MWQNFFVVMFSKLAAGKTRDDFEKYQIENSGELKSPGFVLGVGIASIVIWGMVMGVVLFCVEDTTSVMVCLAVFGTFFVLGVFLVMFERNYKVLYKEGKIVYRNIFRITKEYLCRDIECAYYKDNGGIQFVFKDGRKLSFDSEEKIFCREIIGKEQIRCKFKGEEKAIIKVYVHPFLMCPCWIFGGGMLLGTFRNPEMLLYTILVLLFCLGAQLSYTTYDRDQKILTRRKFGFSKHYNMNCCVAKPFYEEGFLMAIEIYERNKRVAKIPTSAEYKNRARLIRELCRLNV